MTRAMWVLVLVAVSAVVLFSLQWAGESGVSALQETASIPTVLTELPPIHTPTYTLTSTYEPSNTPSPTVTPTPSATATNTLTATSTDTLTATVTATATTTPTATFTRFPTLTETATATATLTLTLSATPTSTQLPTATNTSTETSTATVTLFETLAAALQVTETVASTATSTFTVTPTLTATASDTPTLTATSTLTATTTASVTSTLTATPTLTATASDTPTPSASPSITPTLVPPMAESIRPDEGDSGGSLSPVLLVIGMLGVTLIGIYMVLYATRSAALDRYQDGFVIEQCPVCYAGTLQLQERVYRSFGIPRVRRTVLCDNCRSVLREVGAYRWRYAVDPSANGPLYQSLNNRVIHENQLQDIAPEHDDSDAPHYVDEV